MFNKTMSSAAAASQIFSQANMAAMSSYSQSMQQSSGAAASMYNRQMNDLQAQVATQAQAQSHADHKATSQVVTQDRKNRKKKSSSKTGKSNRIYLILVYLRNNFSFYSG